MFFNSACQQGWNGNGTSCYKLFTSPELTWENAQEECKHIGANLVKIESFLKEKYLLEMAYSRVNHYYWIGLSYSANDSVWKWADGTIYGMDTRTGLEITSETSLIGVLAQSCT